MCQSVSILILMTMLVINCKTPGEVSKSLFSIAFIKVVHLLKHYYIFYFEGSVNTGLSVWHPQVVFTQNKIWSATDVKMNVVLKPQGQQLDRQTHPCQFRLGDGAMRQRAPLVRRGADVTVAGAVVVQQHRAGVHRLLVFLQL